MKKVIGFLSLVIIPFIYQNAYAATESIRWCHPTENLYYVVNFNNTYVNGSNITVNDVESGYLAGHRGEDNYRIESIQTHNRCLINNGTSISCPTKSIVTPFTSDGRYDKKNMLSNGLIKITYNMSANRFDIKIARELTDKYYVRKVPTLNENDDTSSRNMKEFHKSYYPDSQFLSGNTFTARVGQGVVLEFYEKSSSECSGAFVASQYYKMDDASQIKIENPALTDSNSSAYKKCDLNVRKNPKYLNDEVSETIKKAIIPICYKKDGDDGDMITIEEYNKFDYLIASAIPKLDELLLGMVPSKSEDDPKNTESTTNKKNCSKGNGALKCEASTSKSESFNLYANSDFAVTCTDTYKFKGDSPRLTYAGGGFEYGSNIDYSVVRACSIRFIGSRATKPTQCTGCSCTSISTYSTGSSDDGHTGPNEQFDSCINKCDNGKYSQSCINSCYKKVYGEETRRNENLEKMNTLVSDNNKGKVNNLLNYNDKEFKLFRVENDFTSNGGNGEITAGFGIKETGRENTHKGNIGTGYDVVNSQGKVCAHGVFSDWCATGAGHGYITWTCHDSPSGCVWNAEQIYQQRLSSIRGNHTAAVNAMNSATDGLSAGKVTLTIVDSHLKNSNGNYYSYTINNYDSNVRLKLVTYKPDAGRASGGSAVIGERGETVSLSGRNGSIGVNNVRIDGNAYTGKVYGNVVYNKDNRSFTVTKNNAGNYGIEAVTDFNKNDYYNGNAKNGNPMYFTSLFTDNKNVVVDDDGNVSLSKECYNIELSVSGVGTSKKSYSSSNSCYYGVYNNYIYTKTDKCSGDNCKTGDVKYIFRPIELTDVFPDRDPRWNWTDDATLSIDGNDPYLGYNVNPTETTEHIEGVGHTILADANRELDYEIIIDRAGIARIKQYNKDMVNYTNFDMNCHMSGVRMCRSTFLESAQYIKNAGNIRVEAQLGTNND